MPDDGKPLTGTRLGRRVIELTGVIAREKYKYGVLLGWNDAMQTQPIIEYPDGMREVLIGISETNWRVH